MIDNYFVAMDCRKLTIGHSANNPNFIFSSTSEPLKPREEFKSPLILEDPMLQ